MDTTLILYAVLIISGLGLALGVGLGYAGIKFKVETDPRLDAIIKALPGANCGGCGQAGCEAFANAVLDGKAKPNGCPVGGENSTKAISEILGVEAVVLEKMVSFVKCNGDIEKSEFRYDYDGMDDCLALMHLVGGGSKSCNFGCLGGGSCVDVCKFDAIHIINGIAVVDKEKCTACTLCVSACPKTLITMVPYKNTVHVACNSNDAGKDVRKICKVGCISCKMCQKFCEFDAIIIENNLAKVNYSNCTMCLKCVEKCPTKAIESQLN